MTHWVRRLVLLAALAAMAVALPAWADGEHCKAPQTSESTHHHADPGKDIDPAADCPHCPPADCGRHSHCAVSIDQGVTDSPGRPRAPAASASLARIRAWSATVRSAPPTPPPQTVLV
ncbi:MAG: hypothetical protein FJ206_11530 [Gemmatimonadetes bacterium]|nr:hypothetical protein [Gemmatimonadota bacterium]